VGSAGLEPAASCLSGRRKFNLSRCFGCAYQFQAPLRLLQSCSKRLGSVITWLLSEGRRFCCVTSAHPDLRHY
jgi:hypothetical protein